MKGDGKDVRVQVVIMKESVNGRERTLYVISGRELLSDCVIMSISNRPWYWAV